MGYTLADIQSDIDWQGTASNFVKEQFLRFDNYVDEQTLFDDAYKKLKRDLARPKISYKVDLSAVWTKTFHYEDEPEVGDYYLLVDEELGIRTTVQVTNKTIVDGKPTATTIELSTKLDTVADVLAKSIQITAKLNNNQALGNFYRNIINTISTVINSGNGLLSIVDDHLDAVEVDADGHKTGKCVRVSPNGFGVSNDGGATYISAMTGDGILGSTIIANALHILQIGAGGITIESGLPDEQIQHAEKWNGAIFLGEDYNKLSISIEEGFKATTASDLVRTMINATQGFRLRFGLPQSFRSTTPSG
jgi:hypothetical protein